MAVPQHRQQPHLRTQRAAIGYAARCRGRRSALQPRLHRISTNGVREEHASAQPVIPLYQRPDRAPLCRCAGHEGGAEDRRRLLILQPPQPCPEAHFAHLRGKGPPDPQAAEALPLCAHRTPHRILHLLLLSGTGFRCPCRNTQHRHRSVSRARHYAMDLL